MSKHIIDTDSAPKAIGAYSQAIRAGQTVYVSGQIPLHPRTMAVIDGGFMDQTHRVFNNLLAVARECGGSLDDVVKLTVFLIDLSYFDQVNEIMAEYFRPPYPARAVVGVTALPKGVAIEIDAIIHLGD